jgi:hypothetical protein
MIMKCVYLDNLSTTTRITKYLFEIGRPFMKSIDIADQGLSRIGSGCNNLECLVFSTLFL